jgi:glucosamine-6-phosphate deaminase
VPELRKADAVKASLEGPLSTACPGSLVRAHPRAFVYLDTASASKLARY